MQKTRSFDAEVFFLFFFVEGIDKTYTHSRMKKRCDLANFLIGEKLFTPTNYKYLQPLVKMLLVQSRWDYNNDDTRTKCTNLSLLVEMTTRPYQYNNDYNPCRFSLPWHMEWLKQRFGNTITLMQLEEECLIVKRLYQEVIKTKQVILSFDIMPGSSIDLTIKQMIYNAAMYFAKYAVRPIIQFDFNSVTIRVTNSSNANHIYRDWQRVLEGCINGVVGPFPKEQLSDAEIAHDESIRAENKRKAEESSRKYQEEWNATIKARSQRINECPPVEFVDQDKYEAEKAMVVAKDKSGYYPSCYNWAERWARLMQKGMAEEKQLEEVAELSDEADIEGHSGNQYGHAVKILADHWKYGEQLRRWHNKEWAGGYAEELNTSGGTISTGFVGAVL